jgi:hypothetical protein
VVILRTHGAPNRRNARLAQLLADVVVVGLRRSRRNKRLPPIGGITLPASIGRSLLREVVEMRIARRRRRRRMLLASFAVGAIAAGGSTRRQPHRASQ